MGYLQKKIIGSGSKSFPFRIDPFSERSNNIELSPLKVYQFPLRWMYTAPTEYSLTCTSMCLRKKKIREKSRECHNHKPHPFLDTKRKRKQKNKRKEIFNSFITFKKRDAINILENIFYIYKGSKTFSFGCVLSLFRVL